MKKDKFIHEKPAERGMTLIEVVFAAAFLDDFLNHHARHLVEILIKK